jgi:hypothetical protein
MIGHPPSNHSARCRSLVLVAAAAVFATAVLACFSPAAPAPAGSVAPAPVTALAVTPQASLKGTRFTAFGMNRRTRSQADVGRSATALAAVLYPGAPATGAIQTAASAANPATGAADFEVVGVPGLQFSFRGDNDRRLALNANVTSDVGAAADVGADAARGAFLSAFSAARAQGLLSAGLDPRREGLGIHIHGASNAGRDRGVRHGLRGLGPP